MLFTNNSKLRRKIEMRALPPRCSCKQNSCDSPCPAEQGVQALGVFPVSDATDVSNLPAIFFWASKAPRMAGSGHMGFSPRLWGLVTRGSKRSSGFGAGISPELGSASHPQFLFTPAFKGYFTAGCACARGSLPEPGGDCLKMQENKREIRGRGRDALAVPCPAGTREEGQWTQEQSPRGSSWAPCSVWFTRGNVRKEWAMTLKREPVRLPRLGTELFPSSQNNEIKAWKARF